MGGECVERAGTYGGALVRDSKRAGDHIVTVGSTAWRSFVHAVRQGPWAEGERDRFQHVVSGPTRDSAVPTHEAARDSPGLASVPCAS
ncbi:DUF397 domain-containing protein [Streptomyces phaeoluteigriseus]|nr:DUF397 domain-containing protein [Streptomyces phaeoluteigriseus]